MRHTIDSALREAARRLALLPHAEPRLEAELLLAQATGLRREQLFAWPERAVPAEALAHFRTLVERRRRGEPVAYLRGHQAFWALDLLVTPDTLIPRPETELLVELALEQLPVGEPLLIIDAGTGSGAVAAAIAGERPGWTLIAIEHSAGAACVARQNLRRWTPGNAQLLRGDWLAPIRRRCAHGIISNPPYVPDSDPHLEQGDLPFEPRSALAGGADGLDAIRRLAAQAVIRLRPGGLIALEHGFDQGRAVRRILAERGYERIETRRDLAGLDRATFGRIPENR
ncbi:MAG: peptide chain release factor N(5)-glutamine methyltransferase [Pseudomonadota bacterium]|nr:peptide chain release factor N(5)-glutamine methyltransferase [Pseudomonadota bacterium]